MARHTCPAFMKAAPNISLATETGSTSPRTIAASFPPSSRVMRSLRCRDSLVQLLFRRPGAFCEYLFAGRVNYIEALRPRNELPVDEQFVIEHFHPPSSAAVVPAPSR